MIDEVCRAISRVSIGGPSGPANLKPGSIFFMGDSIARHSNKPPIRAAAENSAWRRTGWIEGLWLNFTTLHFACALRNPLEFSGVPGFSRKIRELMVSAHRFPVWRAVRLRA